MRRAGRAITSRFCVLGVAAARGGAVAGPAVGSGSAAVIVLVLLLSQHLGLMLQLDTLFMLLGTSPTVLLIVTYTITAVAL